MNYKINLFNNPMIVKIEIQDDSIKLELCELQTDPFYTFTKRIDVSFAKH
jgi:hypothetical protein